MNICTSGRVHKVDNIRHCLVYCILTICTCVDIDVENYEIYLLGTCNQDLA